MVEQKKQRVAIIGGGVQGLSLAYFLSKNPKYSVTLFERNKNLGGLLGLLEVEGTPLEGFYHHWFTSHSDVLELAEELGLSESLIKVRNKIGLFYEGKIYPFSGALDLLKFSPISFLNRLRLGFSALLLQIMKKPGPLERVNAVPWLKKWCGEAAYRVVWEPLLRGKFGNLKDVVSMAWFWGRVHERGNSPFLVYPRRGFKAMINEMSRRILAAGNQIKTETATESINSTTSGQVVIKVAGKEEIFDKVFVTTPVNIFLRLAPGLPQDYADRLQKIKYRGAHVAVLVLKKSLMPQGYYWLNVNDRDIPLLAVIEHTNLIPKEDYGNKTVVYLGNYPAADDPIMKMPDAEVIELYSKFLPKINPEFKKDWIESYWIFKDPAAQPVVDVGYKDTIPPIQTPIPNLYLVTMAQIYPWDRGTSNAVKQAKEALKRLDF